jgi:hypothetical protein
MRRLLAVALVILATGASVPALAGQPTAPAAAAPAGGTVLLDRGGYWRHHMTWRPGALLRDDGRIENVQQRMFVPDGLRNWLQLSGGRIFYKEAQGFKFYSRSTPLPPADWAKAEFDDGNWPIGTAVSYSETVNAEELHLVCLRARFWADNPDSAGDLTLDLAYGGGAVVYLNGVEVCRGHLKGTAADAGALAEEYSKEAYVDANGMAIPFDRKKPEQNAGGLRVRKLAGVAVRRGLLKRGENVVCVELHRSPVREVFLGAKRGKGDKDLFPHVALYDFQLRATGAGLTPNAVHWDKASGTRVWAGNVLIDNNALPSGCFWGPGTWQVPNGPPGAISLVGARNGCFSGQVMLYSAGGWTKSPGAVAGDLSLAGGGGTIPAANVRVRYAFYGTQIGQGRIDGLQDSLPEKIPPDKKNLAAILVTVQVGRDVKPGEYQGRLTVAADPAGRVEIPVRLSVADHVLPDPRDYASFVGFVQSPESVARYYKVPLWSPEHWKLLDRSFAELGKLGNKIVYLPLRCNSQFATEQTMVRWIRKGDNAYDYDFSVAEKYLDLAVEHWGKNLVVCCYVWDPVAATFAVRYGDLAWFDAKLRPSWPAVVTVLDPATGRSETVDMKVWWTMPESVAFWKPVFDGLKKRLADRGMANALAVGIASDQVPLGAEIKNVAAATGGARWVVQSHYYHPRLWGGEKMSSMPDAKGYEVKEAGEPAVAGFIFRGFRYPQIPDPEFARAYGWQRPDAAHVPRHIWNTSTPSGWYRVIMEADLQVGCKGLSAMGADFWPIRDDKGRYYRCINKASWAQVAIDYGMETFILGAGKDGADDNTLRFAMFREGLQEAETRVLVERVLADPARRGRLGEPLAGRAQKVLDDRTVDFIFELRNASPSGPQEAYYYLWQAQAGQESARRLFAVAGEVEKALGGK